MDNQNRVADISAGALAVARMIDRLDEHGRAVVFAVLDLEDKRCAGARLTLDGKDYSIADHWLDDDSSGATSRE